MAGAFTSKNYQIRKAPRRIELLGDKHVRPEPAQHIIEFPGGAIELSRTTDGCYWAQIMIHRGTPIDDVEGYRECAAEIVDSRIDRSYPDGIEAIVRDSNIEQIAVLIRPSRRQTGGIPAADGAATGSSSLVHHQTKVAAAEVTRAED